VNRSSLAPFLPQIEGKDGYLDHIMESFLKARVTEASGEGVGSSAPPSRLRPTGLRFSKREGDDADEEEEVR
jgi:hypothetical protein